MLEIIDPGTLTTVQDRGRTGWGRYGIPPSGPMDEIAFGAANQLAGNPAGAAALEITLTGPVLRAWRDCLIAVCGAEFDIRVGRLPVPTWHSVFVRAGCLIRFGIRRWGARAYLAVSGGIDTLPFLGSRSTYLKGAFGGFEGRALRSGDRLSVGSYPWGNSPAGPANASHMIAQAGRPWPGAQRPPYSDVPSLRVILGPQDDHFTQEAVSRFLTSPYTITPAADRMGIRLDGERLTHTARIDGTRANGIVSDGVVNGSIQVPPDGKPIVMMVDHQTTGGYPKIGTVIRADLPLLAQGLPGTTVRFRAIGLEEARAGG